MQSHWGVKCCPALNKPHLKIKKTAECYCGCGLTEHWIKWSHEDVMLSGDCGYEQGSFWHIAHLWRRNRMCEIQFQTELQMHLRLFSDALPLDCELVWLFIGDIIYQNVHVFSKNVFIVLLKLWIGLSNKFLKEFATKSSPEMFHILIHVFPGKVEKITSIWWGACD